MAFQDRKEAGELLGRALASMDLEAPIVFGLPRGGVTVAAEVAKVLHAPLDVVIARKLGHPYNREYAIGAVTDDGEALLNPDETVSLDEKWLERAIEKETEEARRRRTAYVGERPLTDVVGKTVVIVDDGIATGFTVLAAVRALRKRSPKRLVVAAPVAPPRTVELLAQEADDVTVLHSPEHLVAIGAYYSDFTPVGDGEVKEALAAARS